MPNCYCGNSIPFQDCCEPYIKGIANAPTAEKLKEITRKFNESKQ